MGRRLTRFADFHGISLLSDVFIETGTFHAETLSHAVAAGFPEVHSIDVVETYTAKASKLFSSHSHVHCHTGTSPDVLPKILDARKHTTFWLDGHYQGRDAFETCAKYGQCPLLAELKVIFAVAWDKPPIVLIDDANMFYAAEDQIPQFRAEDWPSASEIESCLPANYSMRNIDNILLVTGQYTDSNDMGL